MIVAPFRHDSWIFPEKSGISALFPAFPARSRPGSSLEMCGFSPAEKAPSKGNVGGTPVQPQYRGYGASVLPSLPENGSDFGENKVRQRTGAVAVRPPCAGDFVKSRALGRNGTRDSTGVRRAPSPLFLKTEEISARTRSGKEPGQWQYAGTALPRFCSMAAVRSRKIRLCRSRRRNNSSSSPL